MIDKIGVCSENRLHMKIAVDAMGSDENPRPDVAGAVMAAREWGDTIVLVGDEGRISAELTQHDTTNLPIEVVHAPEAITMTDKPAVASRQKKQSSMHIGMNLVKAGSADAFVTAGNTGAVLAVATLHTLRRIRGIKRPALGVRFPVPNFPLLIDGGANADVKPEFLAQFGMMGSLYMQKVEGIANPKVGIISNGEEDGKGSQLVQAAFDLLSDLPINFVGSLEPKQFFGGVAHVGVTDGFTGNVMLKSAEAIARLLLGELRDAIYSSTRTKIGGLLARPAFDQVREKLSPETVGGAPLLGVNGVVIIGHGSSSAVAVKNAIGQARRAVQGDMLSAIRAAATMEEGT